MKVYFLNIYTNYTVYNQVDILNNISYILTSVIYYKNKNTLSNEFPHVVNSIL